MRVFSLLLLTLATCAASSYAQTTKGVSFKRTDASHLEVRLDGKTFAVLNHGENWRKPFLYPVHAPNGANILRPIIPTKADAGSSKEGNDHFHHKGVWVSVDSVNDEKLNFWSEGSKIVCLSVKQSPGDSHGSLTITNNWMEGDKPLVKETTTATFYPSSLVTYQIELEAIDKDVTIYDTKEGFFAVRIAHTMRQMQGGNILNADGLKGEKDCWGKPSPWIDYYGDVEGETCGVTLMDHPDNFRESRYHVRGYGLFSISPFGPKKYSNGKEEASPVKLTPGGKSMKVTYGMYVHNGNTEVGKVAEAYQQFLKVTAD